MTQYMLAVHNDPAAAERSPEELQQAYKATDDFNVTLQDAGAWVFGGGLNPPTSATTVRAHQGELLITDGPFAETKEHLGGFWVIDAPDLDAALDWAEKASVACREAVEVRPFQEEPES
jgi:hypothetical protein